MKKLLESLANAQIPAPHQNTETFRMVRWGKNNRYWLKKFDEGYVYGDFITGLNTYVFNRDENEYSFKELQQLKERAAKARQDAIAEQTREQEEIAIQANSFWNAARHVKEHPYLSKKKVLSHGLKEYQKSLVVPLFDVKGKLWSLQFILSDGRKRFLSGGKKKGGHFILGTLDDAQRAFICEGYATGAAIYECTNIPTIVAFDSGNLNPVAQAIRNKYPEIKITICADNDCYSSSNIGLEKAKEAALAANAKVIIPFFKNTDTKPTDFNDMFVLEGKDAVKEFIEKALSDSENEQQSIPEGFALSDDGLFCLGKKAELTRISNYIKVISFIKSADEILRFIEFKDYRNNLQRLLAKPKMLAKDGDQIRTELLRKGFVFSGTPLSKRKLFEYIMSSVPSKELMLATRTGFFQNVYIRPDGIIGASDDEIILDSSIQDDSYGTSGTLEQWNNSIAKYCEGNSRLIFAVSAAFASLLLRICNLQNFGFHFVGNSSSGKTTCLNVAASVFGTPEYLVTWKATDNAMESIAYKRNDSLLILDELSEIAPSKAGEVAYMLANGQGKKRLDKDCNARETLSWRLIFLSSGEIDLASHMAEEKKTSKAGQKVRLLNISAKSNDQSFGIFENLHSFNNGSEFANYMRENTAKYYGIPSIEFIKHILQQLNDIPNNYRQEFQTLNQKYLPEKAEGQDMRAFERFMFVGFAGELAIKYGIVCWSPDTAYQAAVSCFNSWLEDKEGVGDDENRQILEQARSFLELHGHSRFFDLNGFSDQKVNNMAGYKTAYKDEITFYISPTVFKNEICKGFSRRTVISVLIDSGYLLLDHNRSYRQQKRTPDGVKKVYVISGNILL